MNAVTLSRFATVAAVALAMSGCTTSVEPAVQVDPTFSTGTLIVDWSIGLDTNPADCVNSGAAVIEIHIVSLSGFDAGTFQQSCEAFSTSIVLDPDDYTGTAQLIDGANNVRTTSVSLQPFSIFGGDQIEIPVDFPANSFF
jgi:hypothetical protein